MRAVFVIPLLLVLPILVVIRARGALARRRRGWRVGVQQDAPAGRDLRGLVSDAQLTEGVNFIVSVHTISPPAMRRTHWRMLPSATWIRWRRLACQAEARDLLQ